MHRLFRYVTAALALMGCVSLVITGEMNPVFLLPGLAIIPGYWRYLAGYPPVSRWMIAGLALAEVGVLAFDMAYVTPDFLVAIAHMTIIFQALKSFDMREPWDELQVHFMSLLQLIITSELSLSIVVGVVFVIFLFILVAANVLAHFVKEGTAGGQGSGGIRMGRPLAVISLFVLVVTGIVFVSVPRVRGGIWSRKSSSSMGAVGFRENVEFGSFGKLLEDDTIVLRARVKGPRIPLYWRGVSLDYFDGASWHNTIGRSISVNRTDGWSGLFLMHRGIDLETATVQEVVVEPMDTDVLFGLGRIAAVSVPGVIVLNRDMGGTVRLPFKRDRKVQYTAYSVDALALGVMFARDANRYLALPDMDISRMDQLARDVTKGSADSLGQARAMEAHFLRNYQYSLSTEPPPAGVNPIEHFLFTTRSGYCEYYATSMALMLRTLGVPSRIVNGFRGGEEVDGGHFIIVRQRDAHSWVEAAIDGQWVRFDPTPASAAPVADLLSRTLSDIRLYWYRYVIAFSAEDQRTIIGTFDIPSLEIKAPGGVSVPLNPGALLAVLFVALVAWAAIRKGYARHERLAPVSRQYLRVQRVLGRKGGRVGESSTPGEVLQEALRLGAGRVEAERFVQAYQDARFGGRTLGAEALRRYREDARVVLRVKMRASD